MPSKKPYSWDRDWNPQLDTPPMPHARELNVATLETLATRKISMPPMGQYLFAQTREVEIGGAVEFASGRAQGDWVYYRRGNKQFVRAFIAPRDPKTSYQVAQRERFKHVLQSWHTMTWEQRQAWDQFAATVPHLAWDTGKKEFQRGYRANRLYRSAQLNRLALGLPVRNDAPTQKVTAQVQGVQVVAAPQAGQLAFRLFYGGKIQPGLRVMVEMTRAMPSLARCPRENELTKAGQTEAASYFDLADNGATYVLTSPRHALEPGERFGLRVTLVSEEGMKSRSWFATEARAVQWQNVQSLDHPAAKALQLGPEANALSHELRGNDAEGTNSKSTNAEQQSSIAPEENHPPNLNRDTAAWQLPKTEGYLEISGYG